LLIFNSLIEVSVERAIGDISVNKYFGIVVAVTDDTPRALFKVTRPPRAVEVVHGDKAVLDVCTAPHLERGAEQHPYLALPYFGEKLFFTDFRVCVVNESNIFFGYTFFEQLSFNIVVQVKPSVSVRR
jgi:hypothetical protein